jgi:hypothetical protein
MSLSEFVELDVYIKEFHLLGTFTDLGFRNGYIGMPKHIYEEIAGDRDLAMEIDVHGGVTWCGEKKNTGREGYIYVGFDCAHYQDAPDIETFKEYFPYDEYLPFVLNTGGKVRDLEYVREQIINTAEGFFRRIDRTFRRYCNELGKRDLYISWVLDRLPEDLEEEHKLFMRLYNIEGDE